MVSFSGDSDGFVFLGVFFSVGEDDPRLKWRTLFLLGVDREGVTGVSFTRGAVVLFFLGVCLLVGESPKLRVLFLGVEGGFLTKVLLTLGAVVDFTERGVSGGLMFLVAGVGLSGTLLV